MLPVLAFGFGLAITRDERQEIIRDSLVALEFVAWLAGDTEILFDGRTLGIRDQVVDVAVFEAHLDAAVLTLATIAPVNPGAQIRRGVTAVRVSHDRHDSTPSVALHLNPFLHKN